jgi:toxin ParE1/3/4
LPRVLKTLRAERDLDDIWFYIAIAADNPEAADRLLDTLMAQARLIATQPKMGIAHPELSPEIRSFIEGRYVIFYRPVPDGIEIVRVLHGARDLEAIFYADD